MRHPIVISSHGKIEKVRRLGVRPSLPYQGIARRALKTIPGVVYDISIDVSGVFSVVDRGNK